MATLNRASGWGLVCTFSITVGWLIVFWLKPDFLADPNEKHQMMAEYPAVLLLWYILDWIIFGIAATLFSFAITDLFGKFSNLTVLLINLTSISFAAYCIAVGLAEILTVVAHLKLSENASDNQYLAYAAILQKLRGSTEFSGDMWLILLNSWLLTNSKVLRVISGSGIVIGLLGILILFYPRYTLVFSYVTLHLLWFLSISIHLMAIVRVKTPTALSTVK